MPEQVQAPEVRCLIWAAVSSRPQAAPEKDSLPSQIQSARDYIGQHESWHEVTEPLVVPGHSRSYLFLADAAHDMPEYAQLMELARSGSIDLLVCRSYDRLGRTDALVAQILGYLRSYNCQVLSLDMPAQVVEPEQYEGQLDQSSIWTSAIGGARAQSELVELRRRHRFGMRARVRSGRHPGKAPLGYRKTKEGMVVHESEAEVVRLIFAWFRQGMAPRAIGERLAREGSLNLSETRIRYILRNPSYAGIVTYSRTDGHGQVKPRQEWLLAEGAHEPIISRQEWEGAQLDYARRGADRRSPYSRYPLSGLVYCGFCGRRMKIDVASTGPREYRYYVCDAPDCRRNSIDAIGLEDAVAKWVWRSCQEEDPAAIIRDLVEKATERDDGQERLQTARDRIEGALERYAQDYEYGLLARSQFYQNKARLEDQLASIDAELTALEERRIDPEQINEAMSTLLAMTDGEHADQWRDQENVAAIKAALRTAGVRITVADGRADFALSFP